MEIVFWILIAAGTIASTVYVLLLEIRVSYLENYIKSLRKTNK
jgi:hypothetical protein